MRLRQELESLGHKVEIEPGWPTQFVVYADGQLVFSHRKERRLPRDGEISERICKSS